MGLRCSMWDLSRQHTGLSLAVRRGFQSAGAVVAIYDLIASQLVGSQFPDQKSPALEGGLNPWTTRVHASLESHWLGLHSPRHTDPEGGRVVTNKYQTVSQFWDLALLLWLADLEHILFLLWLLVSSLYPWCCFFFSPSSPPSLPSLVDSNQDLTSSARDGTCAPALGV